LEKNRRKKFNFQVGASEPQVFVVVRRRKVTYHMQFGESATFLDVKKEIERNTQIAAENQALYYNMNGELMNENLTFYQSGFPGLRHRPADPAVFYVSFRRAGQSQSVLNSVIYSSFHSFQTENLKPWKFAIISDRRWKVHMSSRAPGRPRPHFPSLAMHRNCCSRCQLSTTSASSGEQITGCQLDKQNVQLRGS
jgi:hypothetical protein